MGSVTFNIVSTRPDGEYCLYLVEEPPVEVEFIDRLRAIQSRLYEAVEAVIQGKVAERSKGVMLYHLPLTVRAGGLMGPFAISAGDLERHRKTSGLDS